MTGSSGGAAFRTGGSPTVRIAPGGALLVLDAAATRLLGEEVTHVRLLFDRDTRRFGLMPTREGDPDAFAVEHASGGRSVRAKAFVDRYRIPVGRPFRLEREGDMVAARITEPVPPPPLPEG